MNNVSVSFLTILHSSTFCHLLLLLALALAFFIIKRTQDDAGLPPGPFSWPVIGNIHLLGSKPHESLTKLAKTLGDVYRLQLGSRRVVVLNSLESVKESLVKKSCDFSSRPPLLTLQVSDMDGRSISFAPDNPTRTKIRRLATIALHSYMLDHEQLAAVMNSCVKRLGERLTNRGEDFDPAIDVSVSVGELNLVLIFGDNVDENQALELSSLMESSNDFIKNNSINNVVNLFPWLATFFRSSIKPMNILVRNLFNFVETLYVDNKKQYRKDGNVISIAHAFIRTYDATSNERVVAIGEELNMNEEVVIAALTDLFGASVGTTSTTITWALLYLASNLDVQERLFQEINEVVGVSYLKVKDKHRLPFLEATVLEVLRLSTVLPLAIPHYANNETRVGKYRVPKDTMVFVNLWAINHDERVFNNPYQFDPCHFLDENGQVNKARFSSIPFSSGTRKCLGHLLAQLQLFLLIGGLVQKYKFEISGSSNTTPEFGFILRPQSFKINVCQRK